MGQGNQWGIRRPQEEIDAEKKQRAQKRKRKRHNKRRRELYKLERAERKQAAAKAAFLAEVAERVGAEVHRFHRQGWKNSLTVARSWLELLGFTPDQIHALATTGELPEGDADETV